jgi:hypothetical protein
MKVLLCALLVLLVASGNASAAEAYKMTSIGLLQPEYVMKERVADAAVVADYIKAINAAAAKNLEIISPPVSRSGSIYVAVRPGNRAKAWLAFGSDLPAPVQEALLSAVTSVPPITVSGGTLVFCINAILWGAKPGISFPMANLPDAWRTAMSKHNGPVEMSMLADLAWDAEETSQP